jgi:hypothetical protein
VRFSSVFKTERRTQGGRRPGAEGFSTSVAMLGSEGEGIFELTIPASAARKLAIIASLEDSFGT